MVSEDIEQEAEALYEQCVQERGPRWEQLSDVTRSVWREYVALGTRAQLW